MRQEHFLANVTEQEIVLPQGLGLGYTQIEQTTGPASLADALYLLTMNSPAQAEGDWPNTEVSGRWAGDRVAIFGNCSDRYGDALEWTDITPRVLRAFEVIFRDRVQFRMAYGCVERISNDWLTSHRFVDQSGWPLKRCPKCNHPWEQKYGVNIIFAFCGQRVVSPSRLWEGTLLDIEGRPVHGGFYDHANGGGCGRDLRTLEGVVCR